MPKQCYRCHECGKVFATYKRAALCERIHHVLSEGVIPAAEEAMSAAVKLVERRPRGCRAHVVVRFYLTSAGQLSTTYSSVIVPIWEDRYAEWRELATADEAGEQ